jgi:nitrous oxide reductase accessory protein NosL
MRRFGRALFRLAFVLAVALITSSHVGAQERASCDWCGMYIDEENRAWHAGGRRPDGRPLRFDTPKCLFRYHHERGGVQSPWVTGYLTHEVRDARRMYFVLGTEVRGPMGRDLVPIEGRARAERFMRDRGGDRVLSFDEVTRAIAASLFGGAQPSPRP